MLGNGDATLLCSPRVLCAASDTLIATRKAGIGDTEEGSGHRQRNRRVLALRPWPPAAAVSPLLPPETPLLYRRGSTLLIYMIRIPACSYMCRGGSSSRRCYQRRQQL